MLSFGSGAAIAHLKSPWLRPDAARASMHALAELDLEGVVLVGLAPAKAASARGLPGASSIGLPSSSGFRLAARHGTVATPPSAMRASAHRAAVEIERDRRGGQRELIRLAVADLEIERAAVQAPPGRERR